MSKITKCTSIEWLVKELKKSNTFHQIMHELGQHSLSGNEDIIAKAKAMHKEEILDAWDDGYDCGMYQEGLGIDYYNETYLGIIKEEE